MYQVVMPKLGLTMDSGTLIRWFVEEGGQVSQGEPLFEVQTDKVNQEVTAPVSGILRGISLQADEEANIGTVIAYIVEPGDTWPPADAASATTTVSTETTTMETVSPIQHPALNEPPGRMRASPKARRLAKEMGIDLTQVLPTSPTGRIKSADVRAAAEWRSMPPSAAQEQIKASPAARRAAVEHRVDIAKVRGSGPGGRIKTSDVLAHVASLAAPPAAALPQEGELVTPSAMHQVMARRMTESFRDVPHFYLTIEVNALRLVELRAGLLDAVERQTGIRLTLSDLMVRIIGLTLAHHPHLNARWENGQLRRHTDINLGLATAVEQGLLVPVIHQVDRQSLIDIVKVRKALVDKAQAGKLTLDDISGGTFTLSNLGMFGIDLFQAIINPPEGGILAVGAVRERPVVEGGQVVARPTFFMTLSTDHRVTDGAHAARFLQDLKAALEAPYPALLPGG